MLSKFTSKVIGFFFILVWSHQAIQATTALSGSNPNKNLQEAPGLCFIENKGQVLDQFSNKRTDVLCSGMNGGLVFHLKKSGISYQLTEVEEWKELNINNNNFNSGTELRIPQKYSIQRVDLNWVNANEGLKCVYDDALPVTYNYYHAGPEEGFQAVRMFNGVWIKNLYNKIDAHFYNQNNQLKSDYVVAPGGDYKNLNWKIEGAELSISKSGSLLLVTPYGTIEEGTPIVFQANKSIPSKWVLNGNILSLEIGSYNKSIPLIIDPLTRAWGSYYGGTGDEWITGSTIDASGNIYVSGFTSSVGGIVIATVGSHKATFGGGATDAFLAKFNSAGVRQWATYYGGTGNDIAWDVTFRSPNIIYLVGETTSTDAGSISTALAHQTVLGGSIDGFLARFDLNGIRIFGTYYGGTGEDRIYSVDATNSPSVLIGGETSTSSGTSIATPLSYQPAYGGGAFDGFYAMFTLLGIRIVGSYYGGTGNDVVYSAAELNGTDYVIGGQTNSGTGIASAGSHQSVIGGGLDGFLARLNLIGVRAWGTYYGGSSNDVLLNLTSNTLGDIVAVGNTESSGGTSIATAGSHQAAFGGGTSDGYVVSFTGAGLRNWGSYYGGNAQDKALHVETDASNNIYFSGSTFSNDGTISSANEYQTVFGGVEDAYLAKFSSAGSRLFSTYYGGSDSDQAYTLALSSPNYIYIAGRTGSSGGNSISSSGSHQSNFGGGVNDGFLAKFFPCDEPTVNATQDFKYCNGSTGSQINFITNQYATQVYWQRKSTAAGSATNLPSSGQGSIPAYIASNSTCVLLIDSIIVSPVNKLNATDSCIGPKDTFLIITLPNPSIDKIRDSSFCDAQVWAIPAFSGVCTDSMVYHWIKVPGPGGTTIPGLPLSGSGNIPPVTIFNAPPSCLILTDTIKVIPYFKSIWLNDSCAGPEMKFIVKSVPVPVVTATNDTSYCIGSNPSGFSFNVTCSIGTVIKWYKSSGAGGSGTNIPSQGTGSIPSFVTFNNGNTILVDTIFVSGTFVSVGDSCIGPVDTFLIKVLPRTSVYPIRDTTYCHGSKIASLIFTGPVAGTVYNWTRTGPDIGIPSSGVDNIPMFMAMNNTSGILMNTITVTPSIMMNGVRCDGPPYSFKISVYPRPVAYCQNFTVYLNNQGSGSVTMDDINNGSIGLPVELTPSSFSCIDVGSNMATLTVSDSCGNTSTCVATITVHDTIRPLLSCQDQTLNIYSSACEMRFNYVPFSTDNCGNVSVLAEDTARYGKGKFIGVGTHHVCFIATDVNNNTSRCCIVVQVNAFANPIGSLSCEDNIQISLDENCSATASADLFLVGGPYRCYDEYKVLIQLWNGGPYIDRDPNKPGTQLGYQDIGKTFKVTILDTVNGNSCWGKLTVEDKSPPVLTCPRDTTITCDILDSPLNLGHPLVRENCGQFSLTYVDVTTKGNCQIGVEKWIRRTWTAVDNSGNKSFCSQNITVLYQDLANIQMPLDYNNYLTPNGTKALSCDERYNSAFDYTKHLKAYPDCVDDYLLDHAKFIANGIRVPHILGWNIIRSGINENHPNPESIYYPAHWDSLACWRSNEVVMWEGTGSPKVLGCSNIAITFTDLVINAARPNCNAGEVGCYKLLRTWTVLDWCTGKIRTHQQIIKITDDEGPEIIYPDSIILNTDAHHCTGQWDVHDVWFNDNCSQDVTYSIRSIEGTVLGNQNSGYVLVDLSIGDHEVYIVAEDCCGNISEKKVVVIVLDNTPPTAVCQTQTVVSLIGNASPGENYTTINVSSFDDGSKDNCAAHVFFKAIRMDELAGTINGSNTSSNVCNNVNGDDNLKISGSQTYFDDDVKFCCNDLAAPVMVVFRVFDVEPGLGPVDPSRMNFGGDLFGHFTDCMVEVTVQNKIAPIMVPPSDVVVSCDFWFDIERLKDPKDSLFGKMVDDLPWRKKVKTYDVVCPAYCITNLTTRYPGSNSVIGSAPYLACEFTDKWYDSNHPDKKYELVWGFDGYITSPCGASFTISIEDLRSCGQGRIIRTFSSTGPNGQVVTAKQTIWVVDCDPFYINRENACDTTDDIIWPDCAGNGTYLYNCNAGTGVNEIGKPIIVNGALDHCALVAIEHTDQIFSGEHDVCYVILRKWVVIDWCQYDPNIDQKKGRWEFTQFIKVNDREKPIVTCKVGSCEPAAKINDVCIGHISLVADAIDSCSQYDWLNFEYKIDLYNNGTTDYTVGTLNRKQFNAGQKPANRNNPSADDNNNPFDASGTYPIGIHQITWYVSDGCGNVGTCSRLFEIKDCKAPTPYCLTSIVTVPMPSTGCIDIWAKDLDAGSYDNCTSKDKLKFYFDGDKTKTSIRVCCDDFVKAKINDELYIEVKLWVEDEEGNKDYCLTAIIVQDNQNICPNVGHFSTITGDLRTESGELTTQASVDLFEQAILQKTKMAVDGHYAFTDIKDGDYRIKPNRNDDPLNGVTTADIIKIQRHILGKETLLSPYKLIAADVNNSKSITSADISEIRKLILGIIPNFSKSKSWSFVALNTQFEDPSAPWGVPMDGFARINGKDAVVDFISIKMGDVTGSAKANSNSVETRSQAPMSLVVDNNHFAKEEVIELNFNANEFRDLSGIQFTLQFDPGKLKFKGFKSGLFDLKDENFGLYRIKDGILTMCWNADHKISVNPSTVIFKLEFISLQEVDLKQSLSINSLVTSARYYDEQLKEGSLELLFRNSSPEVQNVLTSVDANPNPFKEYSDIVFNLAYNTQVTCTIYDLTGRVQRVIQKQGVKGDNILRVDKADFNGSGIYFFQLDADRQSITNKLVLID